MTTDYFLRPTPYTAAKQFAEVNPDFVGNVCILSYTPSGRNGHKGLVHKESWFVVGSGSGAPRRMTRSEEHSGVNALVDISGVQIGTRTRAVISFPAQTPAQKRDEAMAAWFRRTMAKEVKYE